MKLLMLLSFAAAAVALALAAPAGDSLDSATCYVVPGGTGQFYSFSVELAEYCDGTPTPKAEAQWSSYGYTTLVALSSGTVCLELGIGTTLNFNWDVQNSWLNMNYGSCGWGQNVQKLCGWCFGHGWSAPSTTCSDPNPDPSNIRTYSMDCNINMEGKLPKRLLAREPAPEVADIQPTTLATETYELLPTAAPVELLAPGAEADAEADAQQATKTLTQAPEVFVTSATASPAIETFILPFHFQTTEYCDSGTHKAEGSYTNGNLLVRDMDLSPGVVSVLDHLVPNFPPFNIGPYNHSASRLGFSYQNGAIDCAWYDDETWQQCGECRAGLWSAGPLDCASGGSRVKDMDCSFILGTNG